MKQFKLPKTDSIQELAEFWDSHDLSDFEDQLEEVTEPVFVRDAAIKPGTPSEVQPVRQVKKRADGQFSALAGEFFVAAELLRRGFQTSVTFGNAKAIDLIAVHPNTGRSFTIQVKALRSSNYFPISPTRVHRNHLYVFVLLNKPGQAVEYFIVPGAALIDDAARFGRGLADPKFPGIHPRQLQDFKDNWRAFE